MTDREERELQERQDFEDYCRQMDKEAELEYYYELCEHEELNQNQIPETDNSEWFRKSVAEEMTREELEDRLVEQNERIIELKTALAKYSVINKLPTDGEIVQIAIENYKFRDDPDGRTNAFIAGANYVLNGIRNEIEWDVF